MTGIIIYSDFDGTLTQRAGQDTIISAFYQSLLEGYKPGVEQFYREPPLKSEAEVQQLFTAKFGKYDTDFDHQQADADLLICPEAVTLLHEVLKNDQIRVRIVTKNRKDYIQAMLQYQGFTPEEMFKLEIFDSGLKFQAVTQDLFTQPKAEAINSVYVLDDSTADLNQMLLAVRMCGFKPEQIHQHNLKPGQFAWLDYLRAIQSSLSTAEDSVSETTATPALAVEDDAPELLTEQSIPALPTTKQSNTFKTIGYNGAIGAAIGFVISAILVGTGVFAPIGTGILGAIALGLTIATIIGVLSWRTSKTVAQTTIPPIDDPAATSSFDHHEALKQSAGTAKTVAPPVQHFASPLAAPAEIVSESDALLDKPLSIRSPS